MRHFDGYIAVDWSANGRPKKGKDSIWIAAKGCCETAEPENPKTRHEARKRIEALLKQATSAGHRLICGFDFPFGYPKGTAWMLTRQRCWISVWSLIAKLIDDGPDNSNNRFCAAAKLNEAAKRNAPFDGEGPFWGNGLMKDIRNLPRKKPTGWGERLPPNRRYTEPNSLRAQEVWKLFGAGSVGSQALTGIAALHQLRRETNARVWPFETLGESRRHVLVEIYPSLIEPRQMHDVKDACQVLTFAAVLEELDSLGALSDLLSVARKMPKSVRCEEGLILGMHDRDELAGVSPAVRTAWRLTR